ncbi:MAG: alpha/beta hydrolase [Akkermansia sp.]
MSPTPSIDWSQVFFGHLVSETDESLNFFFSRKEEVSITMPDGISLRGWFLNRGEGRPLVIMYGGNGMNVGDFHRFARKDSQKSYLLVNYRGYGRSEGEPTEDAIVADSIQLIKWAKAQLGDESKLLLVGFSIGSGVALQVAARHQPEHLILICPFDFKLAGDSKVFCGDQVAPLLRCPVTIFAGTEDCLIHPDRTKALIAAFTDKKPEVYWFPSDHNELMSRCDFRNRFTDVLLSYQ